MDMIVIGEAACIGCMKWIVANVREILKKTRHKEFDVICEINNLRSISSLYYMKQLIYLQT